MLAHGARHLVPVPAELHERARRLVAEHGPRGAAAELGVGRTAALSLAAGVPVDVGTLARVELADRDRRGAS